MLDGVCERKEENEEVELKLIKRRNPPSDAPNCHGGISTDHLWVFFFLY